METKVTAAAVASAVVPLIMLIASLAGWDVTEEGAYTAVVAVATVAIPLITFVVGWVRKSKTSAVSSGFDEATAAAALREHGAVNAATALENVA